LLHIHVYPRMQDTGAPLDRVSLTVSEAHALILPDGGGPAPLPAAIHPEIIRIAECAPQLGRDEFEYEGVIYRVTTVTPMAVV
jgi:hypothetical protein